LENKFSSFITELKREISAAQEKASQQLYRRIVGSTYQFWEKK